MEYNGEKYYYVYNIVGDVKGMYDSEGNVVAKYSYSGYGEPAAIKDGNNQSVKDDPTHIANINPFRFKGYYFDAETEFYYLNTRYYDPYVCRFLNADAYISTGQGPLGYNMFAYCMNNPIMYADSDGLSAVVASSELYGIYALLACVGGSNIWNVVGWACVAAAVVITAVVCISSIVDGSSALDISSGQAEVIQFPGNSGKSKDPVPNPVINSPPNKRDNDGALYYFADYIGKIWKITSRGYTEDEFIRLLEIKCASGVYKKSTDWGFYTERKLDAARMMRRISDKGFYRDWLVAGQYPHFHFDGHIVTICGMEFKGFHGWYGSINRIGRFTR